MEIEGFKDTTQHKYLTMESGKIRVCSNPKPDSRIVVQSVNGKLIPVTIYQGFLRIPKGDFILNSDCFISHATMSIGTPNMRYVEFEKILTCVGKINKNCNHEWIKIEGLWVVYEDCKKCGAKKEDAL